METGTETGRARPDWMLSGAAAVHVEWSRAERAEEECRRAASCQLAAVNLPLTCCKVCRAWPFRQNKRWICFCTLLWEEEEEEEKEEEEESLFKADAVNAEEEEEEEEEEEGLGGGGREGGKLRGGEGLFKHAQ